MVILSDIRIGRLASSLEGEIQISDRAKRPRRNKIIEGLEEGLAHARGEPTGMRVTTYLVPQRARPSVRPDGIVEISRRPIRVKEQGL
jgi:hypothetical protein